MAAGPIPPSWEVPKVFRERLGARAGRQRAMAADGHLLLILHGLPHPDAPDQNEARLFWRKPDGGWRAQGSGATAIAPLRAHVEELATAIDALEGRAAKAQRARDWFAIMHAAAPLARVARAQSAALQEARELAKGDRDLITVRDAAQDNERSVELIAGHARAGLDYAIAAAAEDNARQTEHVVASQHRLNRIAATFLPIGAVGSLLGVNLRHGLEGWQAPYPFWIVAAVALLVGLAVRASLPERKPDDDRG